MKTTTDTNVTRDRITPTSSVAPSRGTGRLNASGLVIAGLMLSAGLSAPAQAQCSVFRAGLPDFDQRRSPDASQFLLGLPGGGNMYCLPTAMMNNIAYLANQGFNFLGGPNDWHSADLATYNQVTLALFDLGQRMGTHPEDGTGATGHNNGLTSYLNEFEPGKFIVTSFAVNGMFGPFDTDVLELMRQGNLVTVCYGFYKPDADVADAIYRDGGHCVTVRHIYNACTGPTDPLPTQLGILDPWTDGNRFSQSARKIATTGTPIRAGLVRGGLEGSYTYSNRFLTRMADFQPDTDATQRYMDGIFAISPVEAMSVPATPGQDTAMQYIRPLGLSFGKPPKTHTGPNSGPIIGLTNDALGVRSFMVTQGTGVPGSAKLMAFTIGGEEWTTIATLTNPSGPVVCNPDGHIFVIDSGSIKRFDPVAPGSWTLGSVGPVINPVAMTYLDRQDRLAVMTADGRGCTIGRFDPMNLATPVNTDPCPPFVPGVGDFSIAEAPDGNVVVCTGGSSIWKFALPTGPGGGLTTIDTITLPAGSTPRSVQVSDMGTLVFVDGGLVREFERDATGNWSSKADSLFAGAAAGPLLHLKRSRSNMNKPEYNGPAWRNVVETTTNPEFAECLADIANTDGDAGPDGAVDNGDFAAFFTAFFALPSEPNRLLADVANTDGDPVQDGSVDNGDFTAFFASFFSGCGN